MVFCYLNAIPKITSRYSLILGIKYHFGILGAVKLSTVSNWNYGTPSDTKLSFWAGSNLSDLDDLFFKNTVRKVKTNFSLDTFLPYFPLIDRELEKQPIEGNV